jgi:hypothetical protein
MEEKDMLEARSCRYALVACLALVSAACGVSFPDFGGDGLEVTSDAATDCPERTQDGSCANAGEDSAAAEQQCKETLLICLQNGGQARECYATFEGCVASTPPRPEPAPNGEWCQEQFRRCVEAGIPVDVCRQKLEACSNHPPPPPPPPPSQVDVCFEVFRACYDRGADLRVCFAGLQTCLATVPPPPPPPTPEEQCRMEYRRCVEATGDEPACHRRLEQCLANIPPPPPPPPPPSREQCHEEYRVCVQRTGDEPGCHRRLEVCLANVPP